MALNDTNLEIETVDGALLRRFTQMFRFGVFDRPYEPGEIDAAAHVWGRPTYRRPGGGAAEERRWAYPGVASVVLIGQSAFGDEAVLGGPFAVWDSAARTFTSVVGDHTVYVGTSAHRIPRFSRSETARTA